MGLSLRRIQNDKGSSVMAKIDAAEISVQVNAQLAALAKRMLKMLIEVPPITYDQSVMGYHCYYCDADGDEGIKVAHGEGCEYAVLMADAGVQSNALEE